MASAECEEDVVADSEDENLPYPAGQQGNFPSVTSLSTGRDNDMAASSIQTTSADNDTSRNSEYNISYFTKDIAPKSAASISSFAANTDTVDSSNPVSTYSRPRPRPAYRGGPAYKGGAAVADAISAIGNPVSKVHSPLPAATANSPQELNREAQMGSSNASSNNPSKPDSNFSLDIAERTKMRSRKATKSTQPILLVSSPSPIKNPKPKRGTAGKKCVSPVVEIINLTSDEDDELALPPLKLQKSSRAKPKQSLKPASNPPALDQEQDHPPIAFLPNDSDADMFPPSSPLFSPTPAEKRKRKRQEVPGVNPEGDNSMEVDAQAMPPPPQFFASSSSDAHGSLPPPPPPFFASPSLSVNDSGIEINVSLPVTSKASAKKPAANKKPPGEPKKGKKKAQNVDDDDFDLKMEQPQKKKRSDAKAKKNGKKSAGPVEVAQTPKAFKSSEFIDDDEDLQNNPIVTDRLSIRANTPVIETTAPLVEPVSPEKKGTKNTATAQSKKTKKGKLVVMSEEEEVYVDSHKSEEPVTLNRSDKAGNGKGMAEAKTERAMLADVDGTDEVEGADKTIKENHPIPSPAPAPKQPEHTPSSRSYSIASRTKSTPMSELIRRVNSLPGSPFASTPHRGPVTPKAGTAYSPYLKSSRSALSRIAPLHPNRRTPPPPLPKPPPPKKTKKQLEKEEKWEEELQESVEGWSTLTDEERAAMRRARRAMDEGWED